MRAANVRRRSTELAAPCNSRARNFMPRHRRRPGGISAREFAGAASSVERLRTFAARIRSGKFPEGASPERASRAAKALEEFDRGLADDLNTAQALAAIFDLVRDVNNGHGSGEFRQGDAAPVLAALESFEAIFAVLRAMTMLKNSAPLASLRIPSP